MSEPVKVAGICCSALCFCVSLAMGEMNFVYSFGGLLGAILGFPIVGKGLQKIFK